MSDASEKPRPFDVRTIEYLVRLMRENDLSELDLAEGEQRIRLRRGPRVGAAPLAVAASAPAPVTAALAAAAEPAKPARKLTEIKSPSPGTFYAQREPGSPPYVSVGSRVTPTTPVCVVLAMKVNNEILAECSGTIAEVCVKNEDGVEFGTVLFRVEPG